jgi:hypothetical protein
MKLCYLGKTIVGVIYNDTIYDGILIDKKSYCIKDDSGRKNIYPKELFKEIDILFKAKYTGKSSDWQCIDGKVYDIVYEDNDFYSVIDETKQNYMYPKCCFEIIPNNINIMEK